MDSDAPADSPACLPGVAEADLHQGPALPGSAGSRSGTPWSWQGGGAAAIKRSGMGTISAAAPGPADADGDGRQLALASSSRLDLQDADLAATWGSLAGW